MDAVRLVEVRGPEWTIAVDVVEVEGGGTKVLKRIFRDDWGQDRGGDDPGRDQTGEHVSPKTHLMRRHWDPLRKVSPSTPSNGLVARIGGSATAVVYLMPASPSEVQDICDATT